MKYWDKKDKLVKYVEGVRQFFPLASDQLEVISRVIRKFNPRVRNFMDLGCGDGFLDRFIHQEYPDASCVFVDISEEMINKARQMSKNANTAFVVKDFGEADWQDSIPGSKEFDLIISGYAIHHIENPLKKRLYKEIFNLLNRGGLFLNLEHVSSPSPQINEMFKDLFLDCMADYHESIRDTKSIDELASIYDDPEHKINNKLESVEVQCRWLEEIGFANVDCYLKIFELALFGGTKSQ
jgi:ubiquinone/menaquinone biosynthesis C-methylase UbiE